MSFIKISETEVRSTDPIFTIIFQGKNDLIYKEEGRTLVLYTDTGVYKKNWFSTSIIISVAIYKYEYYWEGTSEVVSQNEKERIANHIRTALDFLSLKYVIE